MRKSKAYQILVIVILFFCLTANQGCSRSGQSNTAKTFLRVLPHADKDPTVFQSPPVDRETQKEFRRSLAKLLKQESFLKDLVARQKIRNTDWFKDFGKNQETKAVADLQKNLQATPLDDSDLIEVSMTCPEAALIVNEAVQLFVSQQTTQQRARILNKLSTLDKRRTMSEGDLANAERSLEQVRGQFGFTDLMERNYPHPIEVRVNRLSEVKDNLLLELTVVEVLVGNSQQTSQDPNDLKQKLTILKAKHAQAKKMLAEASEEKRKLDMTRILYQQRVPIRDQAKNTLSQIKTLIEKYRILADDPKIAKIISMGPAPTPLTLDN